MDEELARLERALSVVVGDLARTHPDPPRLRIETVSPDQRFVADADNGEYWSGGGTLETSDDIDALTSVASGVQDWLADLRWTVWPVCPAHGTGAHLRPGPIWLCRSGGGHALGAVGELGRSSGKT